MLATSRERLGVEGEQRLVVGPLATPAGDDLAGPSVVLLTDRARAVRPELTLDDHDLATVCELCRRLDGLPLAIELAAAQSVSSSPVEILAAVNSSLGALSDRWRTVGRHRSLDAVFGWSYGLLTAGERAAFGRLAVFAGGWTADAAAAVTATATELSAMEGSLVVRRQAHGRTRLAMLEPVRQYAAARLDERGEGKEMRARHAAWAGDFAEAADAGLRGPARSAGAARSRRSWGTCRRRTGGAWTTTPTAPSASRPRCTGMPGAAARR